MTKTIKIAELNYDVPPYEATPEEIINRVNEISIYKPKIILWPNNTIRLASDDILVKLYKMMGKTEVECHVDAYKFISQKS